MAIVEKYLRSTGAELAVLPHPDRNCIYAEAHICAARNLDDPQIIMEQINQYKKENYPRDNGLIETSVLVRRNSKMVFKLGAEWFSEIGKYSVRDQISLPYVLWRNKIKPVFMEGCASIQESSLGYPRSEHFYSEPHSGLLYNPIRIMYRLSEHKTGKKKPPFINNENCLRNVVNRFGKKNIIMIADGVSHETKKWLEEFDLQEYHYTKLGNSGTLGYAFDNALNYDDSYLVYFLENDYIHKKGSYAALYEGFALNPNGFTTLYDHPDKYNTKFYPDLNTRLYRGKVSHWRLTPSTTMTFACGVGVLRKIRNSLDEFLSKDTPDDHGMFTKLASEYNIGVVSPVPSFSTHGETNWLAPGVDWRDFNVFA
jgi:hypothetical protein